MAARGCRRAARTASSLVKRVCAMPHFVVPKAAQCARGERGLMGTDRPLPSRPLPPRWPPLGRGRAALQGAPRKRGRGRARAGAGGDTATSDPATHIHPPPPRPPGRPRRTPRAVCHRPLTGVTERQGVLLPPPPESLMVTTRVPSAFSPPRIKAMEARLLKTEAAFSQRTALICKCSKSGRQQAELTLGLSRPRLGISHF